MTGSRPRGGGGRRWWGALAAAVVAAAALAGASGHASLVDPLASPDPVPVIIQLWDGTDTATLDDVVALGGTITRDLPAVLGVAADVPGTAVGLVAGLPGVRAITPDLPVQVTSEAPPPAAVPSVYQDVVGAREAHGAGHRGAGVTVAVIDTGITEVPDLAGRLVPITDEVTGTTAPCVNFSDEPTCDDTFGHGTFIAGLIAGDGTTSGGAYTGVAPEADLLAIKLSGRDGEARVSDVIAAIGWVLDHRDTYGIRVLNLSLRTDSRVTYRVDPLNHAVERAWAAGIVVVVSAGNLGPDPRTVAKPADDPWVISVGSTEDHGTVDVTDDTVAPFSSVGPTPADGLAKPDVVVPGRSLVSLRSPGSEADLRYPYFVDDHHRLGSGTSFSAGVVSGAVAVLLSAHPELTPNEVKHVLTATADPVGTGDPMQVGAGLVDLAEAVSAPPAGEANATLFHPIFWPGAPGTDADFEGSNWQGSNWQGSNWQGSNWQGSNWQGSNWQGSNWQGSNWQGSNWQGSNWQGSNWQSEYWS